MSSSSVAVKRCVAECMGTFLLTFAIAASLTLDYAVPTPLVAALTLMALAYVLGPVSGAHVNPAITVGLFSLRKIKFSEAACYVAVQLLGAFAASLLLRQLVEPRILASLETVPSLLGELLGVFIFMFGVAMVVWKKVDAAAGGLAVGLSLLLGISVASAGSLGVLNPAVALGLGLFNLGQGAALATNGLVYVVAPILGAYLGAQLAQWMAGKD